MFEELSKEPEEEFIKDLKEITNLNNNQSTTDWYDKNKFNKILTTIDNNNFNHKNKIGKFKFNGINNLINNIKNNTISEALAKQKLNALNEIIKEETKKKLIINGQKVRLNLFDDLVETIFNNNKNNNKIVNENNNVNDNHSDNDNDNDNDDNDDYYDNDDDYDDYDNDNDDEITVKETNNNFKKTDETKSFEDQINIFKKYHG